MKKRYLLALILLTLLILREAGIIDLRAAVTERMTLSSNSTGLSRLPKLEIRFAENTRTPFDPEKTQETDRNRLVVRYDVRTKLSLLRWLPFYKIGDNAVEITYLVWLEREPLGGGTLFAKGSQKMIGLASARDYRMDFVNSQVESLKETLENLKAKSAP